MPPGSRAVLRPLSGSDRRQLSAFTCYDFAEPWTDVVQEMIRNRLADALEAGRVTAVGRFVNGRLCGVAAYTFDEDTSICRTLLLAVQHGHHNRGHGTALKRAVLDAARAVGAKAVISSVHIENDHMIRINHQLGANVQRIAGDREYLHCVIPLA